MMAMMRAVEVQEAGGPFRLVERPLPEPAENEVRVKVQACGVCHSDVLTKQGLWPGLDFPRVPGHEVAGIVDAVGARVPDFEPGQRVGVGWYGGHCGHCEPCRRGHFVLCRFALITGISFDGGYAEYMLAPHQALARIPEELSDVDAAPLLCAGITTFNAIRRSGAIAGDLVAILGIGGLGHLGVQFASRMGFHTVAIARGEDKAPLARELGAHRYIDSNREDVGEALTALGGAKLILATATSGKAMTGALGGLGIDGKMIIVGVSQEPVEVSTAQLIGGRRSIQGWPSGSSIDSEDTLAFSARSGVRPMIEVFPLEQVTEAYERMMSGGARFRVVLAIGQ